MNDNLHGASSQIIPVYDYRQCKYNKTITVLYNLIIAENEPG